MKHQRSGRGTGSIAAGWAIALAAALVSPVAAATTLDLLVSTNGTITQGDLVFSGFSANILGGALGAANVDVTPIVTPSGAVGLRFTGVPSGSFAQSVGGGGGGGGAREIIVDVGFTVTVNGTSSRIHGVQQALDPLAAANNNAVINNLTTIPPSGTPVASLFSCLAGAGLPSGGTSCTSPVNSAVLVTDATSLVVDRQIQIIVGQKGGATTGDASTGYFEISFSETACSPLSSVSIAAVGATTICPGTSGGTATVSNVGGGIASEQWGYRTASGGAITAIPGQTGSAYTLKSADFPGAGSFFVVCTTTPTCGAASVSNEIPVTARPAPSTPTISGPSAFCAGSSITLASSSATGNLWSTGATTQSITVSAAGSYAVTVTDANGCSATSAAKVVTANPIPAAPLASNDGPACEGGTLQLTASVVPGATYAWSGPNGFTSQSQLPTIPLVSAAAAGVYSVTATVNGCTSVAASTVVSVNARPFTPVISTVASVAPSATFGASVPQNLGSTYSWSVTGGTLTSANGTSSATFAAGAAGTVTVGVVETNASGCSSPVATVLVPIAAGPAATSFYVVSPCRVVDTRSDTPPALAASESRPVLVAGKCGIPATAKALSLNVTVVPTSAGFLTVFPGDAPAPASSSLNFRAGIVRAVNSVTRLGADGTLGIFNGAATASQVIVDVNGFFQ